MILRYRCPHCGCPLQADVHLATGGLLFDEGPVCWACDRAITESEVLVSAGEALGHVRVVPGGVFREDVQMAERVRKTRAQADKPEAEAGTFNPAPGRPRGKRAGIVQPEWVGQEPVAGMPEVEVVGLSDPVGANALAWETLEDAAQEPDVAQETAVAVPEALRSISDDPSGLVVDAGAVVPVLSAEQRQGRARELYGVVQEHKESGFLLAAALDEIRRDKLYVELGYSTFAAFSERELGVSRQRAYKMIEEQRGRLALAEVSTMVDSGASMISGRAVRRLAPAFEQEPERAAAAVAEVQAETGKPITEPQARQVVSDLNLACTCSHFGAQHTWQNNGATRGRCRATENGKNCECEGFSPVAAAAPAPPRDLPNPGAIAKGEVRCGNPVCRHKADWHGPSRQGACEGRQGAGGGDRCPCEGFVAVLGNVGAVSGTQDNGAKPYEPQADTGFVTKVMDLRLEFNRPETLLGIKHLAAHPDLATGAVGHLQGLVGVIERVLAAIERGDGEVWVDPYLGAVIASGGLMESEGDEAVDEAVDPVEEAALGIPGLATSTKE